MEGVIEVEVRSRFPVRLPRGGAGDMVVRVREGVMERLLHVGPAPVRVRAWPARTGIRIRAEAVDPERMIYFDDSVQPELATEAELELAIERTSFALALEDDMSEFFQRFKRDPLLGPPIHRRPWARARRRAWPWEALAWAITEQLIEGSRASAIQRRVVRRWGPRTAPPRRGGRPLIDVPSPEVIAGRSPAELVSMDLTEARALAMVRCAREVAAGRADLSDPASDRRLLAIREIGPWTIQCLGYYGRGDPDSLPAGDLAFVKLVGGLEGWNRRATAEEVEEYFAPYAPFRGLAGTFALAGWHKAAKGRPLRMAPDAYEDAA